MAAREPLETSGDEINDHQNGVTNVNVSSETLTPTSRRRDADSQNASSTPSPGRNPRFVKLLSSSSVRRKMIKPVNCKYCNR